MSHPVENIMRSTMEQLRQMVDVNTIVGSPVETGSGTVLLPVSKVSMGFVSGGGEYIMGQAATPLKGRGTRWMQAKAATRSRGLPRRACA